MNESFIKNQPHACKIQGRPRPGAIEGLGTARSVTCALRADAALGGTARATTPVPSVLMQHSAVQRVLQRLCPPR